MYSNSLSSSIANKIHNDALCSTCGRKQVYVQVIENGFRPQNPSGFPELLIGLDVHGINTSQKQARVEKTRKNENTTIQNISIAIKTMTSDSNYSVVKRHQMKASVRPVVLDKVDDKWASDKLSDDEVEVTVHEAAVAPLLEEGELDADAIVVSPTGNSASLANNGMSVLLCTT